MQEEWIAEWEAGRESCPVHGGPLSECPDDERDWFPQRHICQPTMQLRAAERLYGLLHEDMPFHDGTFTRWAKKASRDFPFHYLDGVSIWLSPVEANEEDDFLGPSLSIVQQSEAGGEQAEDEQ